MRDPNRREALWCLLGAAALFAVIRAAEWWRRRRLIQAADAMERDDEARRALPAEDGTAAPKGED